MTLSLVRAGGLAVAALILATAPGHAASPSFDCANASSSTEKLICGDDQLAAFDVELARLYGLARDSADLTDDERDALTASQRDWIGERDDCAKAEDERACVENAYVTRIAALRETYPATRGDDKGISLGPFDVACKGLGAPATLTFINSDPAIAYLTWADQALLLTQGRSGSGARYVIETKEGEIVFWNKGNQAMFQRPGKDELTCDITKRT